MSIARMKKLQMIIPRGDARRLIKKLTGAGCLEVERNDEWMSDPSLASVLSRTPSGGENARALSEVSQSLDALKKYAGVKKGLLTPRVMVEEEALTEEKPSEGTMAAVAEINAAAKQIYALQSERSRLESQREALAPWLGCDVPLDYRGGSRFAVIFGSCPSAFDLKEISAAAEAAGAAQIDCAGSGKELHYLVLTVFNDDRRAVLDALKRFGFSEAAVDNYRGTAAESDDALRVQLEAIAAGIDAETEKIFARSGDFEAIGKAYDFYANQAQWDDVQGSLPSTGKASYLCGWCPENCVEKLTKIAEDCGAAYEFTDPGEDEEPPTCLQNGRFVTPFGMVTELYGMPVYRSLVDPNPIVAISYFVFFGLMFSDAAYGLLLFLGCLFFIKKARPAGGMKKFITMFMLCGISTFIWGAAFGSWFGDFFTVAVRRITDMEFHMPAILDPLKEPLVMLGLSLGLGVIHLYAGMILNIIRQAKRGEWLDIIFDELTWMIAIPCLVLGVVVNPAFMYVAAAMLVVVLLTGGRSNKGLGKVTGGLGALYNGVTGNLSDILSYSRLMALAMSTGVIAQVMNTLGDMPGTSLFGWIFFVVIFVIGQVFNFVISILGAFVHSCRLQFVELFGRFYEGGGRDFRPLLYKAKFVELREE